MLKYFIMLIGSVLIISSCSKNNNNYTNRVCDKNRILTKDSISTKLLDKSTFDSFTSYFHALNIAILYTNNPIVNATKLQSLPDPNKKIGLNNLFNLIAEQTKSTWRYDSTRCYFVFSRPMPYKFNLAKDWTSEMREGNTFCKPLNAPVGMDIYFAGFVDSLETEEETRLKISKRFLNPFKIEVNKDDLTNYNFTSKTAYYFETNIKNNSAKWRQWAFVENGLCFVIVSAISNENESILLPDVIEMVKSFAIIDE